MEVNRARPDLGASVATLDHAEVVRRDRQRLVDTVAALLPKGMPYAFMEFPDYGNVGDTAIWLGSLAVLRDVAGRHPSYVCTTGQYSRDKMRRAMSDGAIVLQGGGNFGDIYPWAQQFRERVIAENPDRRIIHMPQTIKFRDPANTAETRRVLGQHGDFHMLVRDHRSVAFAKDELGVQATLAPDGAFGMGTLSRPRGAKERTVALLRVDDEQVTRDLAQLRKAGIDDPVDWIVDPPGFRKEVGRQANGPWFRLQSLWNREPRRLARFRLEAERRLERGLAMLTPGGSVLTDRLHAHILSVLLGLPHVCLDNDYGKIHAYIAAFTKDVRCVSTASRMDEAIGLIADLRNGLLGPS